MLLIGLLTLQQSLNLLSGEQVWEVWIRRHGHANSVDWSWNGW